MPFDVVESSAQARFVFQGVENQKLLSEWIGFALEGGPHYVTGATTLDALQHTLCADIELISEGLGGRTIWRTGFVPWPDFTSQANCPTSFREIFTVDAHTLNRRLTKTSRGYLGLAPAVAEPGDMLCILFGGQAPLPHLQRRLSLPICRRMLRSRHHGWRSP